MRRREAFDGSDRFTPHELETFPYAPRVTPDGVVDRVMSISFIAALTGTERDRVAGHVRALLPDEERLAFPYRTEVWLTRCR